MYEDSVGQVIRGIAFRASALGVLATLSCIANAQVTFTVNRTGDTAGPCGATCNIRQAIDAANLTTAKDKIVFNIPACGTRSINILGANLHVTNPVVIDGTTQPLCGDPIPGDRTSMIELRGRGLGVTGPNNTILHGLILDPGSSGSTIRGLAINSFGGVGIGINSSDNHISDVKLGTDATSRLARPNGIGISINSGTGNSIENSFVSGNQATGIDVRDDDTILFTNIVGVTVDGDPLPNGGDGVSIFSANNTRVGFNTAFGNTIANNGGVGVRISTGNFNRVVGNKISNNQGAGIDLVNFVSNHNQAAPVVSSASQFLQVISDSPPRFQLVTRIDGTLANVGGSNSFRVDLYGNDSCDGAEGQFFITSAIVNPDGTFSTTTSNNTGTGVTAIGRSPDGDTSEFSACRNVTVGTGG